MLDRLRRILQSSALTMLTMRIVFSFIFYFFLAIIYFIYLFIIILQLS